jgi:hypothetical protein
MIVAERRAAGKRGVVGSKQLAASMKSKDVTPSFLTAKRQLPAVY